MRRRATSFAGWRSSRGAALRQVATLVAQQVPEATIFSAVAGEASRALGGARVDVGRWHEDGAVSLLGSTSAPSLTSDHAFSRSGGCVARRVIATGHAARIDDWTTLPAPDAQTRLTDFTHLVASSISNVQARNSLIASRARIVTASDETRRRIERNLHDGIQQRVVSVALSLRARSPIPVTLEVTGGPRFREPVEIAIYYVVSEALANAAKHSRATEISVTVTSGESGVRATITDDGRGGAVLGRSSGLTGLVNRVEALDGRFSLDSRPVRAPRSASSCPSTPRPSTSVRTSELSPGHGPGDRPERGSP